MHICGAIVHYCVTHNSVQRNLNNGKMFNLKKKKSAPFSLSQKSLEYQLFSREVATFLQYHNNLVHNGVIDHQKKLKKNTVYLFMAWIQLVILQPVLLQYFLPCLIRHLTLCLVNSN